MTTTTSTHDPDPEFVRHLEWQVQSELRRRSRWPAARPRRAGRVLRLAGLVVGSALLGAATVVGTVQVQGAAEKKLLLARAAVEVDTARLEVENAAESLRHAIELHERGFVPDSEVDEARRHQAVAERALKTAQRRRDEIEKTGRRPAEGLDAPKVGDRDFVTERLQDELADARAAVETQQARLTQSQNLADRGFISAGEVRIAAAPVRRAEADVSALEQRIDLRQRFLRGEIAQREVALRDKRIELKAHLAELEADRDGQEERLAQTRGLRKKSMISERELRTAEYRMKNLLDRIKIAILEIELVDAELKGVRRR